MEFEVIDTEGLARIGKINVNNKQIITPNLLPVVHPYKRDINISELVNLGVDALFTNSYIIYKNQNIREQVLEKKIHNFLNYTGLIATDSGAFQQYMYNDDKIEVDASEIETFQENISSDFPVILDVPVQLTDDFEEARNKVLLTIRRAKENVIRRHISKCHWIAPIHGGKYRDLLKLSSLEMSRLDYDIFALGGMVKAYLEYRFDIPIQALLTVKRYLPINKPIHMFGLGLPQFFSLAILCGCDLMDSASYILYAKEGRYFDTSTGTKLIKELHEFPCSCPVCINYTPSEVRSQSINDQINLLTRHNLYVCLTELKTIRQAIREGNLWELVELRVRNHPNLVDALYQVYKHKNFIEKFEKIHKVHGRLFSSLESVYRPIIRRTIKRVRARFKFPDNSKYLLILPELDVKGVQSKTIKSWQKELYSNSLISEKIAIVFFSLIFGIIPEGLAHSYPFSQYEVPHSFFSYNHLIENSIKNAQRFLLTQVNAFNKISILIPKFFINQYGEKEIFKAQGALIALYNSVKTISNAKVQKTDSISSVICFFNKDE